MYALTNACSIYIFITRTASVYKLQGGTKLLKSQNLVFPFVNYFNFVLAFHSWGNLIFQLIERFQSKNVIGPPTENSGGNVLM